jgi:DNA-binding NarL/FixJ family response regulator
VIRVLIVDDHSAFRQPLAIMLSAEPDVTVVGQAGSLAEARAQHEDADVAIIDLDLGDGDGADLIPLLRQRNPNMMALVLTASSESSDLGRAVMRGAMGLMHKSAGLEEIINVVRRLGHGEILISPREAVELMHEADREKRSDQRAQMLADRLTQREREVLAALTDGLSDREIGQRLGTATETVRTHMVRILAKLELDSRLQAAIFALHHDVAVTSQ